MGVEDMFNCYDMDNVWNEKDMLSGNINRMFVTDSVDEIEYYYAFAKIRLDKLHDMAMKRLLESEDNKSDDYTTADRKTGKR